MRLQTIRTEEKRTIVFDLDETLLKTSINKALAKKIVKVIKQEKMKVQAAIQGEQVRVSGKKRDDLQAVMALVRQMDADRPLHFTNFRD